MQHERQVCLPWYACVPVCPSLCVCAPVTTVGAALCRLHNAIAFKSPEDWQRQLLASARLSALEWRQHWQPARGMGELEASSNCSWNNLNSGPRLGPKPQSHSWIASWQPQQQQQQSLRLALVIVQISWPHQLRAKGAWQVRNTPEAIAVTAVELTPAMPILPPFPKCRLGCCLPSSPTPSWIVFPYAN